MMTESQVYRALQKHLDELPIGYPQTKSGVEIRILKHLFTPEEAKIATQLPMIPEPLNHIHKRVKETGMSIEELEQVLDHMVYKGTILTRKKDDEKYYGNAMLAVGIFELQVERLTKGFTQDMLQYLDEAFGQELYRTKITQLRTIPIEKSITYEHNVSTYDDVRQIINNIDGQIAVANCVCRQAKDLLGENCRHTDLRETCLIFRGSAEHHLNLGLARSITKEEAFDILKKAEEAGLVLQPENSQRPHYICCCCGDCCAILTTLKKFPCPAELYATNYYAKVDPELCTGCEDCVDQCQLEALAMVNDVATVNRDRCIGCGNCVANCTADAIHLQKKEKELLPPPNTKALYMNIMSQKVG
ncbi:MAG: 4Fe-4S binding protein [Dehalococcoidia bacterium]|nr:4Fe-4S binding protein [Dehalococcoidia bacterium]